VKSILVGLPLDSRGRKGTQALKIEGFIKDLSAATNIPIRTWNERYSTKEAERLVREAGHQPSMNKGLVDAASAAVILNSYILEGGLFEN
jgi:putative Holliday junction resolvase